LALLFFIYIFALIILIAKIFRVSKMCHARKYIFVIAQLE
jgi:hypothetical protein